MNFKEDSRFHIMEVDGKIHGYEIVSRLCLCGKCSGPLPEFTKNEYPYTIEELRREFAHLANKGKNICPECVSSLYYQGE